MSEKNTTTRRLFLANTLVVSTALAGCSGSGGDDATESTTEEPTKTATETDTATETPTEVPTTVENFAYPAGASRDGVAASELYNTHRSSIVDAGSATVTVDQSTDQPEFTSSTKLTNTYSDNGFLRVSDENDLTERLWSPSNEDVGYVEMDTGFEQKYRIDNQAPRVERVLKLRTFENILAGGQWSEAVEIEEADSGQPSVVYEATGVADEERLKRVVFGDSVTEFDATISVTEAGYLSDVSYDITTERGADTVQQQAETTVKLLGETTVEEPSWATTAQEDGIRFNVSIRDDRRAVLLELVNGSVSSDTRINISSDRFGSVGLPQAISDGDTLYTTLSESGEALVGINEMPTDGTELGDFVYIGLTNGPFELFAQDIR